MEGKSRTELPNGVLTPEMLHDHFDLDGDGIVTKQDYMDHIQYHCKYNPYYDKKGNPNMEEKEGEMVIVPKPESLKTSKGHPILLNPNDNKGYIKVKDVMYPIEINPRGGIISPMSVPGYERLEDEEGSYTFISRFEDLM